MLYVAMIDKLNLYYNRARQASITQEITEIVAGAEDCGGAIKTNCIDIYVATHAEGEAKGVYYTEVYLIQ